MSEPTHAPDCAIHDKYAEPAGICDCGAQARIARFPVTYCSSCGEAFGPGDHGFSHCKHHKDKRPLTAREESAALATAAEQGADRGKPAIRPLTELCILRPWGMAYLVGGRGRMLYRCDTCKQEGAFWSGHPVQCLDKEPA